LISKFQNINYKFQNKSGLVSLDANIVFLVSFIFLFFFCSISYLAKKDEKKKEK